MTENIKDKNRWDHLHDALKKAMQIELSLMRELLANMHQEELSMMLQDQGSLTQILSQRSSMVERLSSLRLSRLEIAEEISHLLPEQNRAQTFEQILPLNEEISYEIFNLRDQLMILTEKMNRQQARNHQLFEHPEPHLSLPSGTQYAPIPSRSKKKISVATYQINK